MDDRKLMQQALDALRKSEWDAPHAVDKQALIEAIADHLAQPAPAPVVPADMVMVPPCRAADVGFRFDGVRQTHVPQVLLEFEPVPIGSPADAQGWKDRDALVKLIAADNAALREIISTHARIALEQDARVKVLEQAVQHYEAALKARWPEGARGESFGHWNSARAALEITPPPSPSPRS